MKNYVLVCISALVLAILAGCGGGTGTEEGSGVITGRIRDAMTDAGVGSAILDFINSSEAQVTQAYTDVAGDYNVSVPPSSYRMEISRAGYISETYWGISLSQYEKVTLDTVDLVPEAYSGSGTISGTVVNAFDGAAVSGATITLRRGINNWTGTTSAETTTGGDGSYSFADLAGGVYSALVTCSGFADGKVCLVSIGGQDNPNQMITLTPPLGSGETRIVLTWGETPADLDSHLYGPKEGGGEFHIYYPEEDRTYLVGSTIYAALDLDDTDSYGPETTTIYVQSSGTYTYKVYDFTNGDSFSSAALGVSGAKVMVYQGSGCVASFEVPNEAGTLWTVFELSGGEITPVNTMSYEANP